ncbi:hypothetical protein EYC80_003312 [Monilinia laxa]|uniref:Uncharacterized protein n=1 Tax=Monilinia laxa TaxID=61186 RepID=A0A5N6KDF7_MONLA|nr:hypothetical protein EYC80_003312 [Monilinia laxa]
MLVYLITKAATPICSGAWLSFLAEYIGGNDLLRLLDSFMAGWRFTYKLLQSSLEGCDYGRSRDITDQ